MFYSNYKPTVMMECDKSQLRIFLVAQMQFFSCSQVMLRMGNLVCNIFTRVTWGQGVTGWRPGLTMINSLPTSMKAFFFGRTWWMQPLMLFEIGYPGIPPKFNIAPEGLPKSSRNGLSNKHHFSNFGDSDSVPFEANKNPKDPCMV